MSNYSKMLLDLQMEAPLALPVSSVGTSIPLRMPSSQFLPSLVYAEAGMTLVVPVPAMVSEEIDCDAMRWADDGGRC